MILPRYRGRKEIISRSSRLALADRTIYRILVAPQAHPSAAQVRAVAHVSGGNFLQAKRALASSSAPLFAGRAELVLTALALLDEAEVAHCVEPAFCWMAADTPEAVRAAGLRPASPKSSPEVTL